MITREQVRELRKNKFVVLQGANQSIPLNDLLDTLDALWKVAEAANKAMKSQRIYLSDLDAKEETAEAFYRDSVALEVAIAALEEK